METNEFSKKWIFKILKQSSGDEEKSGCSREFAMQGCRPELSYQQLLNNPSVLCAPVSPALTKTETEVLWVLLSSGLAERPVNSKIQERSCLKGGFSKEQGKSDRDGHVMTSASPHKCTGRPAVMHTLHSDTDTYNKNSTNILRKQVFCWTLFYDGI